MKRLENLQEVVDRLREGRMTVAEVLEWTQHPGSLIRVHALEARIVPARTDRAALEAIARAATDPGNRGRCLLGTTTVAQVAVACLCRVRTSASRALADDLVRDWPESERDDLVRYLREEA